MFRRMIEWFRPVPKVGATVRCVELFELDGRTIRKKFSAMRWSVGPHRAKRIA